MLPASKGPRSSTTGQSSIIFPPNLGVTRKRAHGTKAIEGKYNGIRLVYQAKFADSGRSRGFVERLGIFFSKMATTVPSIRCKTSTTR